jgi:hypothetical protein
VGEAFSLDEPTSPKQPRLRRLNRGWKAAPTGLQKAASSEVRIPGFVSDFEFRASNFSSGSPAFTTAR